MFSQAASVMPTVDAACRKQAFQPPHLGHSLIDPNRALSVNLG